MPIHDIYADEQGESRFRGIEIEWTEEGPDGTTSRRSAAGIIFRVTPGDWRFDWHIVTRRQYMIDLDGRHQIPPATGRRGHRRGRGDPDRGCARQGAPVRSIGREASPSILIPLD